MNDPIAQHLSFDERTMWVHLDDGRALGIPLSSFPRLQHARPEQRAQYLISGGGTGLHWQELDEDISVPHLLRGHGDRPVDGPMPTRWRTA